MSEKYKTEEPFKQYLLQNSPIRQLCPFLATVMVLKTFFEVIL